MLTYKQIIKAARLMEQCGEGLQIGGPCDVARRYYHRRPTQKSSKKPIFRMVLGTNPATGEYGYYRQFIS